MDFPFHEAELWPVYVPKDEYTHRVSHANLPKELIDEYVQAYHKFMDVRRRVADIIELGIE